MAERLSKELSPESSSTEDKQNAQAQGQGHGQAHTETESGIGLAQEDDEIRESTYFRLENLGYRVGQGLAERYVPLLLPLQAAVNQLCQYSPA